MTKVLELKSVVGMKNGLAHLTMQNLFFLLKKNHFLRSADQPTILLCPIKFYLAQPCLTSLKCSPALPPLLCTLPSLGAVRRGGGIL